jgi:hypothetical protein
MEELMPISSLEEFLRVRGEVITSIEHNLPSWLGDDVSLAQRFQRALSERDLREREFAEKVTRTEKLLDSLLPDWRKAFEEATGFTESLAD